MAVDILYNGICPVEDRPLLKKSVIDAIGRLQSAWKAWFTQGSGGPGFLDKSGRAEWPSVLVSFSNLMNARQNFFKQGSAADFDRQTVARRIDL